MGHNALIALDNEFLNIFRVIRVGKILFAEAAEAAKLPDLVLPLSDTELFVNIYFLFRYPIDLFIKTEPFVGHFIYDDGDSTVKTELKGGTPYNGNYNVIPRGCRKGDIQDRDNSHCHADYR